MLSKQVTDRIKSATALLAIIEGQLEALVEASSQRLSPMLLKSESLPDLRLTYQLAGRSVEQAANAMKAADQAHAKEQNDLDTLFSVRDTKAEQLSERLVKLRQLALGAYGASSLTQLGFSMHTPQDHAALAHFAQGVVAAFRSGVDLVTEEEASFNPKNRLEAIEKDSIELEVLLKKVATAKRKVQKTQDDKNKAIAAYDLVFSQTASFFVGAFRLAGMDTLAKKVRPSTHRPGQLIPENENEDSTTA